MVDFQGIQVEEGSLEDIEEDNYDPANDPDFNDFNNLPPDESDRGFDEMAKEGKLL